MPKHPLLVKNYSLNTPNMNLVQASFRKSYAAKSASLAAASTTKSMTGINMSVERYSSERSPSRNNRNNMNIRRMSNVGIGRKESFKKEGLFPKTFKHSSTDFSNLIFSISLVSISSTSRVNNNSYQNNRIGLSCETKPRMLNLQ